jgi:hypothetical protein
MEVRDGTLKWVLAALAEERHGEAYLLVFR